MLPAVDAALATAIEQLNAWHLESTAELNAAQVLRARLGAARTALAEAAERLDTLADENRQLKTHGGVASTLAAGRYASIFQHALDAILVADDDGRYIDANPAACELLGYTREELLRANVREVTPDAQRPGFEQFWAEFLGAGTMSGEYTVQTRTGEQVTVEFRAVANIAPGEHVSIMHDVTRLRTLQSRSEEQRQRERAEAMRVLYVGIDSLVAAKVDIGAFGGWRRALLGEQARRLADDIDAAISTIRSAIEKLGGI